MIGAFLSACGDANLKGKPFANESLRRMREAATAADGTARLVVRHRLIENLPYFLSTAPVWARRTLIKPLGGDSEDELQLWRAVARRTQFRDVLRIIGVPMAKRASDPRLSRDVRKSLAFSVVVELLHAFNEGRVPAISWSSTQQMLRSVEDEVRSHAADAVARFVRDLADKNGRGKSQDLGFGAEELFERAAAPFLLNVWPQERTLATPGVARAFAELPYTSRHAFVAAVASVERFLVPFDCWSIGDFGLRGSADGSHKLALIDSAEKAVALLRLLDRCIASQDGAVVPTDLDVALAQVEFVAPKLVGSPSFRRLAAISRRQ